MKETSPAALPSTTKTPGRAGRPQGPREMYRGLGEGASTEAKRLAAAILEVLAGARTPTEAAQVLALSLPRYYLLEARALHGIGPGVGLPTLRSRFADLARAELTA